MKTFKLLLPILLLMSFSSHKFYISLTQIEYIESEQSLQIISSVFIDDLELTLQKYYDPELFIGQETNKDLDSIFENYIQKNILIQIHDKQLELNLIATEIESDEVFFYIEATGVEKFDQMQITNTLLFEEFKTQENIIKSKVGGKHKSAILTIKNDTSLLNY